ncbi:MAG: transposase [Hyphomicrobiales bacterium]|nr:transposase [Hyphomicrobiales bacterium]
MGDALGWYSRGYLPHFDSPEILQHIVFRTWDSLPPALAVKNGDAARRASIADEALDRSIGSRPLDDPLLAGIVQEALLHFDGFRYHMSAWCVMPNHAHVLIELADGFPLPDVVHSWKSFTATRINANLGRRGPFWARDYFDRFMRSEAHFESTVAYIENNPVKAGLCERPQDWLFSSARRRGVWRPSAD